jgi:hypothetical protein
MGKELKMDILLPERGIISKVKKSHERRHDLHWGQNLTFVMFEQNKAK